MMPSLPRSLPLEGASNVRDLGGWPVAGGGSVRFGRVFRSAALTRLTKADRAALAGIELGTVCDLRGRREAARAPYALAGCTIHALSIEPSVGASLRDLAAWRKTTEEGVLAVMRRAYVAYALEWSHRYRAIFALLLEDTAPPLLLHCTAGKDRTGLGVALILTALGVPYEAVREDYLASNRLWRCDPEIAAGLPDAVATTLLRVHPELLDAAFDAIRREHGDFTRYAETALGLDAASMQRLRDGLLDPGAHGPE